MPACTWAVLIHYVVPSKLQMWQDHLLKHNSNPVFNIHISSIYDYIAQDAANKNGPWSVLVLPQSSDGPSGRQGGGGWSHHGPWQSLWLPAQVIGSPGQWYLRVYMCKHWKGKSLIIELTQARNWFTNLCCYVESSSTIWTS